MLLKRLSYFISVGNRIKEIYCLTSKTCFLYAQFKDFSKTVKIFRSNSKTFKDFKDCYEITPTKGAKYIIPAPTAQPRARVTNSALLYLQTPRSNVCAPVVRAKLLV